MKSPVLFDLTGRVAVVTGGNGGIGRGIALGLAQAGAAVAVLGRNDEKNQRVFRLQAIGVPSVAVKVDVTNRAGLAPALNKVESELGPSGILVKNAGNVSLSGGVLNEKAEDWDNVIETQLNAVFLLSKLTAKFMVIRKSGKIINIGSMYSYFGSGLIPSYSAAKGAIVQLTKSMAIELAPHNIQVNAIAPGWIETEMTAPVKTMHAERRNPGADSRRSMGTTGGSCRNSCVPGLAGFGLHHRYYHSCRRRLCDPVTFLNLTNVRKTIHLK
jgi:2-deoxy-D-gluconate 3-dehydrogenase